MSGFGNIALIIIISIFLIIIYLKEKREKIVQETSVMLKKLLELNSKYDFDWSIQQQYKFKISLQTKAKFDRYDLNTLFEDVILNNSELLQMAKIIENNRTMYKDYFQKSNCIKSEMTQEQAKLLHVSFKQYVQIEQKLFNKQQIIPVLDCDIVCIALYSSPKGQNHYSKTATYKIDEVPQCYMMLQQKIANQDSEKMRRKRARAQMSDKLRYSILKRDGFRCKICGRTADDGVKLHVDHIVPVSKGGETVPSNLRTLCEDCNWGKGDEIE